MFFCNKTIRMAFLSLLSSQASLIHALPADDEVSELVFETYVVAQQSQSVPLAPPGPYFSSAMPKETAISQPIQMPASVAVDEQIDESLEKVVRTPVQTLGAESSDNEVSSDTSDKQKEANQVDEALTKKQDQKIEKSQGTYDIGSTNPLADWPLSTGSTQQWAPAPPAPPGPYGFVPSYTPRSAVNPAKRHGYRDPYYPGNTYGMPPARPGPGIMYPQMRSGYANPGYSNPGFTNQGYYYGRPNTGGYNQGNYNRGGFDPRMRRNNLNQNDINQARPE